MFIKNASANLSNASSPTYLAESVVCPASIDDEHCTIKLLAKERAPVMLFIWVITLGSNSPESYCALYHLRE